MLKNSIIENEELRHSITTSDRRYTEINIKHKIDKDKVDNLEKDVALLRKHYIVLESEKLNVEKKYKK
jgi:hypothetical protein